MRELDQRFCILIPCYEKHAAVLDSTLREFSIYDLDCIVVDDGSSAEFALQIKEVARDWGATLIRCESNAGKGAAVKTGLRRAYEMNFTHALQVDADGQHDAQALREIISLSKANPETLISGRPLYDDSVPSKRKWGRYLTHVWVWIETLSFSLEDSMCGFRSYPLRQTVEIINTSKIGDRMDFDTEIMVHLYWRGINSKFVPVKVIYPEGGESYFDMLQDNVRITKMHTRLFFGMLVRVPMIMMNKLKFTGWNSIDEKGLVHLIKFTSWLHDVFGERFVNVILKFISLYYYLFAFSAKKSSRSFRKIYTKYASERNFEVKHFNPFTHILSFAKMFRDKISVWKGKITLDQFNQDDLDKLRKIHAEGRGALFISSHYGNMELIRALGQSERKIKYNALIYTKNSKKIFNILKELDPSVDNNVIFVQNFGPEVGAQLHEKVSKGEWIFCMGDRVTDASSRTFSSQLLGEKIQLPYGPFVMSYLLHTPIYSIHCYREQKHFRIQCHEITPQMERNRATRSEYLRSVADSYIKELEGLILKDPKQWFNFYHYWKEE